MWGWWIIIVAAFLIGLTLERAWHFFTSEILSDSEDGSWDWGGE